MKPALLLAQADMAGLDSASAFQEQLLAQSTFIAILYGIVFVAGFILLTAFTLRVQSRPLDWSGPLDRLFARPWTWRDAVAIVVPLLLAQAAFAMAHRQFIRDDLPDHVLLAIQGVLFHGVCFLLIVAMITRRGIAWSEAFGMQGRRFGSALVWGASILVGVMPLIIAYNLVAQLVMQWWNMEPQLQDVTRVISGAGGLKARVYFVLLAVVVAPVVEEMLFRGILLPAFAKVAGIRPALILVAVLFSLVHGFFMPAAVIFFILSIAFSLAYIYRQTLWVPVVMHACFNGLTMLVLLRM